MKKMHIIVRAVPGAGKNIVAWRLLQVLREEFGIECEHIPLEESLTAERNDELLKQCIENKSLGRTGLKCIVEEQQMPRREIYEQNH